MFNLFKKKPKKLLRGGPFAAKYANGAYYIFHDRLINPFGKCLPYGNFEKLPIADSFSLTLVENGHLSELMERIHRELFKLLDALPKGATVRVSLQCFPLRVTNRYEMSLRWRGADQKGTWYADTWVLTERDAFDMAKRLGVKIEGL